MSNEELEQIGLLSDKADNLSHAAELPLPPEIHLKCLSGGMADIRDALRKLYIESSGVNPWNE